MGAEISDKDVRNGDCPLMILDAMLIVVIVLGGADPVGLTKKTVHSSCANRISHRVGHCTSAQKTAKPTATTALRTGSSTKSSA